MSLTAMTRENALLESSTESNSAPSGTGIDLGDPAEFQSWEHDRSSVKYQPIEELIAAYEELD